MTGRRLYVTDPNWSSDAGGGGKGANEHYDLDDPSTIARAFRIDPWWSDVGDALVWMWATVGAVNTGAFHELAARLHVRPCANFVWIKADVCPDCDDGRIGVMTDLRQVTQYAPCPTCKGRFAGREPPSIGQWSICEHEHLFLCRRGDVDVSLVKSIRPRSWFAAPRGEHSEKPEKAWRQVIEPISRAVLPGVVGIEYNCRKRRAGWSAVGRLDGEDAPIRREAAPSDEVTW